MKSCNHCNKPATLKEGRELYCGKHYIAIVMGVSGTTINGKTVYAVSKAA